MSNSYNNFTAPTRPPGDSSNAIATTAFVSHSAGFIHSSFPQDDQPVEWSDKVGGYTNVLLNTRTIPAQTTSPINIDINNPPGTIGGHDMEIGQTIFLSAQTNPVENFLWRYAGDGLPLTRPTSYPNGKGILAGKTVVSISLGDYQGTYWILDSPTLGTIGTSPLIFGQFTGGIFPREPNTVSAGPFIVNTDTPQAWRHLFPNDLPPGWNGDTVAWMSGGQSMYASEFRRGQNAGYWSQTTPWAGHSEVVQSGQFNDMSEIDMPGIPLEQPIGSSALAALELVSHSGGPDGVINLYVMGDYPALDLSGIKSFKITGALRIHYRNPPAPGTHAVYVHGACSDIDLGDLYLSNCNNGVYCFGAVNRVRLRTLGLRNWTGYGISTSGSGVSNLCTNVLVERILWHNDTPGGVGGAAVVARCYEWSGAVGIPGLTILSGYGDGAFTDFLQDASASTRQPLNTCIRNFWGKGATGHSILINYGTGLLLLDNTCAQAAALDGIRLASGTNFTGQLEIRNPSAISCGQNGINILGTSAQRVDISGPRIKSCSASSSGTYHGINIGTGVVNGFSIRDGVIGDQGASASMGYGINLAGAAGAQNFFEISSVDCRGNVTGTILNPNAAGTNIIHYCPGFNAGPW